MAQNYVLLERIELNASAASVTFSNIPQSGYTDLKVVISGRTNRSNSEVDLFNISINGNTSAVYSTRVLYGTGAGTASGSETGQTTLTSTALVNGNTATANTFSNTEVYIPNYTSSNAKSISGDGVAENNGTTGFQWLAAGLFNSSSAISSLTFSPANSSLILQYSTFSLYGLAAVGTTPVIAPKASGGNIQTDGTYWYHTFLTSGTFTPATNLTCDALVVAGGGGGGYWNGGGGGAGGLVGITSQAFTSTTAYTVTVGSGGSAGGSGASGGNGSNSQIGSLTAAVGGGGGGKDSVSGLSGGSGGGAGYGGTGGSATSGQGYAGGAGDTTGQPVYGGGGGGATAVGTSADINGKGGAGSSSYSSWGSATVTGQNVSGTYYYAGGGTGGNQDGSTVITGGNGGGGSSGTGYSSTVVQPTAGTTNTGGGGGGGTAVNVGAAGGSGIVIIRYSAA